MHLKQDTTINVKYKPEVARKPSLDIIYSIQDDRVDLYCKYEANPMLGTVVSWYKNGKLITFAEENFERGSEDSSILKIVGVTKESEGVYSCAAENEVGRSAIADIASIYVEEKPRVTLSVEPENPVSELSNADVTLKCLSERGERFMAVKWYLDGELLKHVERAPECYNETTNDHGIDCSDAVDPSKIILVNVRRSFHGNYSCRGMNRAGWGAMAKAKELRVMYPPKGGRVVQEPAIVKKGNPFKVGRENHSYRSRSSQMQWKI